MMSYFGPVTSISAESVEEEADAYYERVQRAEHRGDYCAEARWRRAWMSYVNEDWRSAATKLRAATQRDCDVDAQALARAE